ncbi:MAG: hypothetical protein ABIK09_15875 [Pseudomonadota bacterium]
MKDRRHVALVFPYFLAEVVRERRGGSARIPLAVHDRTGRVISCDQAARDRGVRPGMRATQVRTILSTLGVIPAPEDGTEALRGAARRLLDLSPGVWCRSPDTLVVEIGSILPLHASEAALVARLCSRLEHPPRVLRAGVADGGAAARTAALLARDGAVVTVPPGDDRAFLGTLPLDDLDLMEETRRYLQLLGVGTLGEVVRVPRGSWERRLREGARLYALAVGEWGPGEVAGMERILTEEQRSREAIFEPPVESAGIVLFRLRALLDRLGVDLLQRAEQIGALGIRLLGEGGSLLWEGEVRPAAPTRDPALLTTLARLGLDTLDLREPVGSLQVELREVGAEGLKVDDLFWQERKHEERWRHMAERLSAAGARSGGAPGVLFRADLTPDHLPERSFRWIHWGERPVGGDPGGVDAALPGEAAWLAMAERGLPPALPEDPAALTRCRPSVLLDPPEALDMDSRSGVRWRGRRRAIRGVRDLGQVETDWWREDPISRRYRALRLDDDSELFVYQDEHHSWWLQGVFE